MRDPADDAALVALLRIRPNGLRWTDIAEEVQIAGSALAVWQHFSDDQALFGSPDTSDALEEAQRDLDTWSAQGMRFLSVLGDDFPVRVRSIREVPPFLMARGQLVAGGAEQAVSVVGSRKASAQGLKMADAVARALVGEGLTVLSGLAEGIDAAAHTAALDAGGRSVAIIGTGLNLSYPAKNRELQARISEAGLLLSQFWPDGPPQRHNFLMRNAVMSGYGRATVVIEAGEQSGARAQARMAVEHGRPVIITDHVLKSNKWAQALRERPRVFVASGVSDVIEAVLTISQGEREAAGLVAQLVPEFA